MVLVTLGFTPLGGNSDSNSVPGRCLDCSVVQVQLTDHLSGPTFYIQANNDVSNMQVAV